MVSSQILSTLTLPNPNAVLPPSPIPSPAHSSRRRPSAFTSTSTEPDHPDISPSFCPLPARRTASGNACFASSIRTWTSPFWVLIPNRRAVNESSVPRMLFDVGAVYWTRPWSLLQCTGVSAVTRIFQAPAVTAGALIRRATPSISSVVVPSNSTTCALAPNLAAISQSRRYSAHPQPDGHGSSEKTGLFG